MSKFKVGDKVVCSSGAMWAGGDKFRFVKHVIGNGWYRLSLGEDWKNTSDLPWSDSELKLYEEPTEFTFQEVIARINPGEKYVQSSEIGKSWHEFGISVSLNESNDIVIEFFKGGKEYTASEFFVGFGIEPSTRFKLDNSKEYTVYEVEFKKAGPHSFKYVSNQELELYTFVNVGDSNKYARVISKDKVKMTEEEYKQMKECWEA